MKVPAAGGEVTPVTTVGPDHSGHYTWRELGTRRHDSVCEARRNLDRPSGRPPAETAHSSRGGQGARTPMLPDGRVLFTRLLTERGNSWEGAEIVIGDLESGQQLVVLNGEDGRYVPTAICSLPSTRHYSQRRSMRRLVS